VFFGRIPEHIGAIYPSWYKFKNSIVLQMRLSVHGKPFPLPLILWDKQLLRRCFNSPDTWSAVCYCAASFTLYWKYSAWAAQQSQAS